MTVEAHSDSEISRTRATPTPNALMPAEPGPYEVQELSVDDVIAQVQKIQHVMGALMQEGTHYGKIPGTPKPTLFKAGAEKLCLMFRLGPRYAATQERDGEHLTITSHCTLYHTPTGKRAGDGMGSCSTKEKKYAYRKGYNGQSIPNPDLADMYNTVLKMANKRSLVAATLNVTAASDIFTQDLEDLDGVVLKRGGPVRRTLDLGGASKRASSEASERVLAPPAEAEALPSLRLPLGPDIHKPTVKRTAEELREEYPDMPLADAFSEDLTLLAEKTPAPTNAPRKPRAKAVAPPEELPIDDELYQKTAQRLLELATETPGIVRTFEEIYANQALSARIGDLIAENSRFTNDQGKQVPGKRSLRELRLAPRWFRTTMGRLSDTWHKKFDPGVVVEGGHGTGLSEE